MPVAGLVLAAGAGTRYGQPKAPVVLDGERMVLGRVGRVPVVEGDVELMERLVDPAYVKTNRARPQRAIVFTLEAWDVNCQQHIVARYSEAEMAPAVNKLVARIKELEEEVARLKAGAS